MAGGVDISKRKPRRLANTPAKIFCNRVSFVFLSLSVLAGVGLTYSGLGRKINDFYNSPEALADQKEHEEFSKVFVNSFIPQQSAAGIKKILDHKERYETSI